MNVLCNMFTEVNDMHHELLMRYIIEDMSEENQEALAIFESNLIEQADVEMEQVPKQGAAEDLEE